MYCRLAARTGIIVAKGICMGRKSLFGIAMVAVLLSACAAAPPVNGEWALMLTAAEGSTSFPITIDTNGTAATASSGDAEFSGTWINGELWLTGDFYVPEAGYSAPLNMTMRVEDGELRGSATWDQFQADVLGQRME